MATHPIYDDPGATVELGSTKGHLRSNEVKIQFSPNYLRQDGDRDAQIVPSDLARRAVSEDTHIDVFRS